MRTRTLAVLAGGILAVLVLEREPEAVMRAQWSGTLGLCAGGRRLPPKIW